MSPWLTHLLTFIGGLIVGVFGNYYAAKLTDRRRSKESKSQEQIEFERAKRQMPELIAEMREDLLKLETEHCREFFILSNPGVSLNLSTSTLFYYEDQHANLKGKVTILENLGYLYDITMGRSPKYRMEEHFVQLLVE